MSIVTKTGDQGETGLLSGKRVKKSDPCMEVLGDMDELSAQLGFLVKSEIQTIQRDLFELSALLAGAKGSMSEQLKRIETELSAIEAALPPLKNFIFQGGHPDAARLYLARAVCRRAERHLSVLPDLPSDALPYLNRLSDYLFLLARKINLDTKTPELLWKS